MKQVTLNNKDYKKVAGLESLNMFKGQLYETIVTTQNGELVKNAAPIGVICKDSNHVVIHLDNWLIVNITKNPLVFTYSTLGELDDEYFDEFKGFPMIKDSIGFFKAHVVKTRDKKRENDYNDGIGNIVTCEVDDIYISDYKEIVPLNRAMNAVIESLIYYCRFDHKYSHMQKEIWTHMKELNRVCHKVGNESEKKSMELILAKMKETHDYLE